MESLKHQFTQEFHKTQIHFMNKLSPKLKSTISFTSFINIKTFCASSPTQPQIIVPVKKPRVVPTSNAQLKENWLASLSYTSPSGNTHFLNEEQDLTRKNDGSKLILGVDPDVSGAVALLKIHDSVCSAQVPIVLLFVSL